MPSGGAILIYPYYSNLDFFSMKAKISIMIFIIKHDSSLLIEKIGKKNNDGNQQRTNENQKAL